LADRVLMKIFYLLLRWLFGLAVLAFRGDQAKDAELLVLRHENAVLRRHAGRVRYEPADRAWFAALACACRESRPRLWPAGLLFRPSGRDDQRSCACGSCSS
jgi:hypothetical protein